MKVQKINGVCSMLMVSDNPRKDTTKEKFLQLLYDQINLQNEMVKYNMRMDRTASLPGLASVSSFFINCDEIKEVLMVTNNNWWNYWFMKNRFSYYGNSGKAIVMAMHFPDGLNEAFRSVLGLNLRTTY